MKEYTFNRKYRLIDYILVFIFFLNESLVIHSISILYKYHFMLYILNH